MLKVAIIGLAIAAAYYLYTRSQKVSCSDGKYRVITAKSCPACKALKAQAKADNIHMVNEADVTGLDDASASKVQHVPAFLHGCKVLAVGVKDVLDQLKKHQPAHTQ